MALIRWEHVNTIESDSFICGYCGKSVASEKGWVGIRKDTGVHEATIFVCPYCTKPTFFDIGGTQIPGAKFGNEVDDIDNDAVKQLYDEARSCTSKNAFTASVLCCRKLLMHIAVSKGAGEDKNFIEYVEYLSQKNFIPPDAKDWVDHIRSKGNEANHEIVIMEKEDATDLIVFMEMLLKLIFEFPANIKKKKMSDGVL